LGSAWGQLGVSSNHNGFNSFLFLLLFKIKKGKKVKQKVKLRSRLIKMNIPSRKGKRAKRYNIIPHKRISKV
jgi:hypothetical protein